MSILELGALGEFLGAFGVIASLAYLGVQVRQVKRAGAREVAFELIRSFQTVEFTRTMQAVFDTPTGLSKREIEERFEGRMDELLAYLATWESIGILVHRGQIGLDLVCDFFSHPLLHSWDVMQAYMVDFRREMNRDTPWEWFQWLAERVIDQETDAVPKPAYEEFRDWKPRF
jgi:hypothetical protein